jgi:hypothetical protein
MNIFYLHQDPKIAAEYHVDKHVVKMIIEYAQLMSTAHRLLDGTLYLDKTANGRNIKRWKLDDYREPILYKASHINHPSAIWVRQSDLHYNWLWHLYKNLCQEYRYRYGGSTDKQHKTSLLLSDLSFLPYNIPRTVEFQEPPQAMPEAVKVPGDSIQAYRNYYKVHKAAFANWKKRSTPDWYK